jgi:hypothetical protein
MAFPTLACKYVSWLAPGFGSTQPATVQFNQITVYDESGTWLATFQCDPLYSSFVPGQIRDPLSAADFAQLWLLLLPLLLAGFGVKMILRVFKSHGV